jgi:hypothetical protein
MEGHQKVRWHEVEHQRPPSIPTNKATRHRDGLSPGAKRDAETPVWKQPFWYWIKWLNARPFSVEALSGIFDFNRAPFFQSFMEVRVERSRRRVVLVLTGVHGPLHWADLQTG